MTKPDSSSFSKLFCQLTTKRNTYIPAKNVHGYKLQLKQIFFKHAVKHAVKIIREVLLR